MANNIHPTALIDPTAEIDSSVTIGAYSVIGAEVKIGAGTSIGAHVVIEGPTTIGKNNKIYQFASIGADSQDKKYKGERTTLEIGDGNTIREFCTINRGTAQDKGYTKVGNDNWLMAYVHIAHDCVLGDHIIMANCSTLGGHVELEDYVILGGFVPVHQFSRIGCHSMVGGNTPIVQDVPPYVMVGRDAAPHGINSEGLKRRGFSPETITEIKRAYKTLYRQGLSLEEAKQALQQQAKTVPEIKPMLDFIAKSTRGIIR